VEQLITNRHNTFLNRYRCQENYVRQATLIMWLVHNYREAYVMLIAYRPIACCLFLLSYLFIVYFYVWYFFFYATITWWI